MFCRSHGHVLHSECALTDARNTVSNIHTRSTQQYSLKNTLSTPLSNNNGRRGQSIQWQKLSRPWEPIRETSNQGTVEKVLISRHGSLCSFCFHITQNEAANDWNAQSHCHHPSAAPSRLNTQNQRASRSSKKLKTWGQCVHVRFNCAEVEWAQYRASAKQIERSDAADSEITSAQPSIRGEQSTDGRRHPRAPFK